jgi:NADH-quinone oxidoreductase subunit H
MSVVAARIVALLSVCALALTLLSGCESQVAPPLVEVTELAPLEIEPGDRLEVHGVGFPQGRTGRLTLRGTVLRAGQPPIRSATIEASGTVIVPDRLEVIVRDALAERFCGAGDHAVHATFKGDLEVSFASNTPGAPPLVGTLRSTSLDVQPAWAHKASIEAQVVEGGRLLAFMGVVPGAPTPRGVPVEQVQPSSLAERAGIQVGDVIAAVDGVHVLSLGDVVPASARSVELTIRHGASEETKTISLVEYAGERVPAEYAPALVIVGLALAVLALLVLPGPPSLTLLEVRIASRLRRTTLRALLGALLGSGRHAALSAILSAIVAAFALTPYVVGPEVDGVLLLAGAGSMLVWSRIAVERGVMSSLRTLVQTAAAVIVMAAAIALAIAQVGAIELAEIVRVQGAAPWDFSAARHPAHAILAVVYGAAIIAILRARAMPTVPKVTARSESARAPKAHALSRHALLERAGVLLASALGVVTFCGGWQMPGNPGRGMLLAAAGVFVMKTWFVAAVLFGVSRVLQSHRPRDIVSVVVKRLVPALVLAAGLAFVSRRIVPSLAIETAFGATLVALTGLFLVRMATRVHATVSRPETHASPIL